MYDFRLVSAYMTLNLQPRKERRPLTGHPARRVYQLPTERRTPRNDRSR
jgi:hypothetical protein